MRGVRPENLSDRELEKYAYLALTTEGLPKDYAQELLKRYRAKLDDPLEMRFTATPRVPALFVPALFVPAGSKSDINC